MSQMQPRDRLMQLYADLATQGVSREEMVEIERLEAMLGMSESDREAFELAAAMLDPALAGVALEPAPASVRTKLHASAAGFASEQQRGGVARRPDPQTRTIPLRQPSGGGLWAGLGWLAAAACLALAAVAWWSPRSTPRALPLERVAALPDAVRWAWASGPDETGRNVRGEVVFSTGAQEGYMTFTGLPALEEGLQYQLWIIDPDQKHPIDGGVFDAPRAGSEARVPIDAKLAVRTPAAFAVTVEKQGGVVVSDQSRVTVIAKPS